jgi:branched-chain amino acid transport system ATP-binding protein
VNDALEVTGLSGGYTKAPVIRDVHLLVDANEIVGLLGANGAGKSTVLRAISGSLPVCRGDVRLGGRALNGLSPWARVKAGLVHVPEGRHVFAAMSVRENLDVAALVGRGRVSRDEVFDLFPRLRERQQQAAGSLSGGEQQMLAIGRALMTGPRLLAVDEMSAGLAPVLVEQLVDGLVQLRGRGTGVLLVEQSPHVVAGIVDRVYLLEHGSVVGAGSLDELGGADRLADLYLGV